MTFNREICGSPLLRFLVTDGRIAAMSLADLRRGHFIAWMEAEGLSVMDVVRASEVGYTTLRSYLEPGPKQTQSLKGENEARIANAFGLPIESIFGSGEAEPEANYAGAWRRYKGLELDHVAKVIGVPPRLLEDLEAGRAPLSAKWRRRLAPVFGIGENWLLLDPDAIPPEVLEVFLGDATDGRREMARQILAVTLRTGTAG